MKKLSLPAAIVLSAISFVIYLNFYDILIPGLPDGSYRLAVGSLFAIPALLLTLGQVGIGGLIILFAITSLERKKLSHGAYVRSLFIASVVVFLFSLTYVMYPMFGPFYYIVFSAGGFSPSIIAGEIAWTIIMLAASTFMIKKLHKTMTSHAFVAAVIAIIFIIVAAS